MRVGRPPRSNLSCAQDFCGSGLVPNGVYSCGSLMHGRQLGIPRAISDDATTAATLPLDEVLAALE